MGVVTIFPYPAGNLIGRLPKELRLLLLEDERNLLRRIRDTLIRDRLAYAAVHPGETVSPGEMRRRLVERTDDHALGVDLSRLLTLDARFSVASAGAIFLRGTVPCKNPYDVQTETPSTKRQGLAS